MKVIEDLGVFVEGRWRQKNYHPQCFAEIAEQAFHNILGDTVIDPYDAVRWVLAAQYLPEQLDIGASFGQPPITLYRGPLFHIDVLLWLDGSTDIHQHSFDGAFKVIEGSSIHSRYTFRLDHDFTPWFRVGETLLESVELLKLGDTRRIQAGERFVHSLFHLDRPSATLIIRTNGGAPHVPQWSYRKPYVAVDSKFMEPLCIRKVQCIAALLAVRHPQRVDLISQVIRTSDVYTTYLLLNMCHRALYDTLLDAAALDELRSIVGVALQAHGPVVERFLACFEYEAVLADIARRRRMVTIAEHRLFLALLLNVPDRSHIFRLVEDFLPGVPAVDRICEWIGDMVHEVNVLGLTDCDEFSLFVLRCMLEDKTPAQITEEVAAMQKQVTDVERVMASHRACRPLHALFASSRLASPVP